MTEDISKSGRIKRGSAIRRRAKVDPSSTTAFT